MHIPLNWLKDYVDLGELPADEIGERLTLGLCEVEEVEQPSEVLSGVCVGEILDVSPHPQADRLQVARVDIGQQDDALQIVCGAPNIKAGQKVPVAVVGAYLPGESEGETFKIKKSKIRGVPSQGMLCSEKELGLGGSHEGILILDSSFKKGIALNETPILENPGATLVVDNKSLTHRSDCWGFVGLARELGSILKTSFKGYEDLELVDIPNLSPLSIDVQASEACLLYQALRVSNVQVTSSPSEWVTKLESAGLRSINNVVDATNLVLLEIGQPLHAFDSVQVKDQAIVVRYATQDEQFTTLDGVERELTDRDLVIADSQRVLALAGIMGGENSSVSDETAEIILEGANFHHGTVRRSSLHHGLRSDSSSRFEKGLSQWLVEVGLRRCLFYLQQTCPGLKIVSGLSENVLPEKQVITLPEDLASKRLGRQLDQKTLINHLSSLGFSVEVAGGDLKVTVPPWRGSRDIERPEDLIEEIGRIEGYTKIVPYLPLCDVRPASLPKERMLERGVRNVLADQCGMTEVLNYSFISDTRLEQLGCSTNELSTLQNPLQEDRPYMRPTLLGGLLDSLAVNHRQREDLHLFEIGRVFLQSDEELPNQKRLIAGLHRQGDTSFHSGKRAVEALLSEWNISSYQWNRPEEVPQWAHPGRMTELFVSYRKDKFILGTLAEVHPKLLRNEGVLDRAALWEIDLSKITSLTQQNLAYKEFSKYPVLTRDIALVVDESMSVGEVIKTVKKGRRRLISCDLFDIYRGKGLSDGKKSLAFHLSWQDPNKTLTDQEIDLEEEKLLKDLSNQGWTRR